MNGIYYCESTQDALRPLLDKLMRVYLEFREEADTRLARYAVEYPHITESQSAVNLIHYLALRGIDLRELQDDLAAFGLSSLGRGESGIIDNLNRVIGLLSSIVYNTLPSEVRLQPCISLADGMALLERRCEEILGPASEHRSVRIMVTLPSEAADDYELVKVLIDRGMNCARINCAHDDKAHWQRMIDYVRKAEQESGKTCRIMMDLAGQKLRTGPFEPGPAVHHIKVKRDEQGKVIAPGYVQIVKQSHYDSTPSSGHFRIGLDDEIQSDLEAGHLLNTVDRRGKHRQLEVVERDGNDVVLARSWKGIYLGDSCLFQIHRKGNGKSKKLHLDIPITNFEAAPAKIRVFKGDHLLLTASHAMGRPAVPRQVGEAMMPAQVSITQERLMDSLEVGHSVWFDDGKVGSVIEEITDKGVLLRITHARSRGTLIREDKGINFPNTELNLPALTGKDLDDLDFVAKHADLIGYSFVQSKEDMQRLMAELNSRNAGEKPIVAKIETSKAVKNLPEIILSTIDHTPLGIMIARGDLAVELGSVRMAEIQEEILWLCEAAHVPVIWATQVLETLAKQGVHSRPEITDAAMSVRAECVMLNKGPYIHETVEVLDDILSRMQEHQHKKTSRLRALQQWPMTRQPIEPMIH